MASCVAGVESAESAKSANRGRYVYDERDEQELNEEDLVRPSNALEDEAQYKAALEASLAEETRSNLELVRQCDEACAEADRFKFLLNPVTPHNSWSIY